MVTWLDFTESLTSQHVEVDKLHSYTLTCPQIEDARALTACKAYQGAFKCPASTVRGSICLIIIGLSGRMFGSMGKIASMEMNFD